MLYSSISTDWLLLLSRIILGTIMLRYGLPKVKDFAKNSQEFVKMGFKPGWFWGTPIALLEFFGGIGMLVGFLPEIIALFYSFMMLVGAIWKTKVKKSYGTISYDLCIFALCQQILFFGPGKGVLYNYSPPPLQWIMLIAGIFGASIMAFLPEILGQKYRNWQSKS